MIRRIVEYIEQPKIEITRNTSRIHAGFRHEQLLEKIRIRNRSGHDISLFVEPWGKTFVISESNLFEIVLRGPIGKCARVDQNSHDVTVWGWSGCEYVVYRDGNIVDSNKKTVSSSKPLIGTWSKH